MGFKSRVKNALVQQSANVKNLDAARQTLATEDTARFIDEHMAGVPACRGDNPHLVKLDLLAWAVDQAPRDGLAVEFGVATGETLAVIAQRRPAHGFDSFEGLPENWYGEYQRGTFAQPIPEVSNSELHVGWFTDTLPKFLIEHPEPWAFVHMDADLYESTRAVFDLAGDRFRPGTVVVFDEFFNYPGWRQHEYRAWTEFGRPFEFLCYNATHEQVAVRLL
jgi:hypothetical protein